MGNVSLRNIVPSDEKIIFKWISNPYLRKMTGTRGIPNSEGHAKWFSHKINDQDNAIFIIENDNIPVGIIGTNTIDKDNRNAEIYLYIGEESQKGKGIGYSAIIVFLEYLKKIYNLHKINARVFSFNSPSIGLFEKCKFILEGTQKEQIYSLDDNRYYDLLWYTYIYEKDL